MHIPLDVFVRKGEGNILRIDFGVRLLTDHFDIAAQRNGGHAGNR